MLKYSNQAALIAGNLKDFDKEDFEKWFLEQINVVSATFVVAYLEHKQIK